MFDASDPLHAAYEDRIAFETLIADLASQFVNTDADLIDGAIEDAQRRLVEALGVDRSSLFQVSDTEGTIVFTHSWSRPGLPPMPSVGTDAGALFAWAAARIRRGDLVCISSLDEVPADAPDRQQILRTGTKSNVTVPLVASAGDRRHPSGTDVASTHRQPAALGRTGVCRRARAQTVGSRAPRSPGGECKTSRPTDRRDRVLARRSSRARRIGGHNWGRVPPFATCSRTSPCSCAHSSMSARKR
jgi:hypothetical protein